MFRTCNDGSFLCCNGCAGIARSTTGPRLEPAPTAREAPTLDEAAVERVDGGRVVAQAAGWPGELPIREEVLQTGVSFGEVRIPFQVE